MSVVNLSISCSAYGERRVSCSSNGDSPQYSWSVDGRPLRPPEASPSGSTERPKSSPDLNTDLSSPNLPLPEGIQGHLTCSARNNISSANKSQLLPSCISKVQTHDTLGLQFVCVCVCVCMLAYLSCFKFQLILSSKITCLVY